MTDKTDWLAGLKVGDEVVVQSTHMGRGVGRLDKVERLAPTRIVLEQSDIRFRRSNGRRTGSHGYHSSWLEQPTADLVAAIRQETLAGQLKDVNWWAQALATLEAVAELVAQARKAKQ